MKLLALIGGRKDSSSEAMAKLALLGAREAAGEQVEVQAVRLLDLNIQPCTGCNACVDGLLSGRGVGGCVRKDDFQWLTELLMQADGVIVSLPIFEKTVPGYFKDLCDRCGPGMDAALREMAKKLRMEKGDAELPDPRTWKRRAVAFIAHGGSDWNQSMMPVMMHFAIPLNMEIVDQLLLPWDRQKLLDEQIVQRLKQTGAHMARCLQEMPEELPYIGREGHCPVCHNDVFRLGETAGEASCACCGMTGTLRIDAQGRVSVVFPKEELAHSHLRMGGKYQHLADMRDIGAGARDLMPQILATKKRYSRLFENSRPESN